MYSVIFYFTLYLFFQTSVFKYIFIFSILFLVAPSKPGSISKKEKQLYQSAPYIKKVQNGTLCVLFPN